MNFMKYVGLLLLLFSTSGSAQTLLPMSSLSAAPLNANADSTKQFDVYCDFRCPYCARLFSRLLAGARAEQRTLDYRFLHFPFHSGSMEIALFYEAAMSNYPDQRDSLIESLYKFRGQTGSSNFQRALTALATLHAMDEIRVRRDMRARDSALTVSDSKRTAVALSVDATPTVFYRGQMVALSEPEEIARFMLDHSPQTAGVLPKLTADDCPSCQK